MTGTRTDQNVPCPECGAASVSGMTCWEMLGAIIAWAMTIADAYLTDHPPGAAERVRAWADTIRRTRRMSISASAERPCTAPWRREDNTQADGAGRIAGIPSGRHSRAACL